MRFFLNGLPGSGKTYWGRKWARNNNFGFFDLDNIISENEGFSIGEIFKSDGEAHFRNLEKFYLKKLISNYQHVIIACGGGTAAFNKNMELMKENGYAVFLNIPIDQIANNLMLNADEIRKRPLFAGKSSKIEIQEILKKLLHKRIDYYNQANYIIESPKENSLSALVKEQS